MPPPLVAGRGALGLGVGRLMPVLPVAGLLMPELLLEPLPEPPELDDELPELLLPGGVEPALDPMLLARSFTCSTTRLMTLRLCGVFAAAARPAAPATAAVATAARFMVFLRRAAFAGDFLAAAFLAPIDRLTDLTAFLTERFAFATVRFTLFFAGLDERFFDDAFLLDELRPFFDEDFFADFFADFFEDFFEDLLEPRFDAAMFCLLLTLSVWGNR